VYVLSAQSAPHVDHEPTQLTFGGQSPSPAAQLAVSPCAASHALPVPDCAVVIVYVLSAQSAPHVDHEPTQLTSCAATSLAAMQSHVSWDYCGQRNAGASTATPLKGLTSEANRGGA
jgi:hypothetical protein